METYLINTISQHYLHLVFYCFPKIFFDWISFSIFMSIPFNDGSQVCYWINIWIYLSLKPFFGIVDKSQFSECETFSFLKIFFSLKILDCTLIATKTYPRNYYNSFYLSWIIISHQALQDSFPKYSCWEISFPVLLQPTYIFIFAIKRCHFGCFHAFTQCS